MLFPGVALNAGSHVRYGIAIASLVLIIVAFVLAAKAKRDNAQSSASTPKSYASDFWYKVVPAMNDEEFRRHMRLTREQFRFVATKTGAHRNFAASNCRKMPVDICLALVLMRLAYNMPYRLLCHYFGVSEGSVRNATVRTMCAIKETFMEQFVSNKWPTTDVEYEQACRMMSRCGKAVFPNCIGALDVTHVPVCATNWGFGLTKENFIDRTGKISSLSHQCIVNGNLQFIDVEAGFSGRAHDMGIFKGTLIGIHGHDMIRPGYYVLADAGYAQKNFILRPFDNTDNMTAKAEKLNYLLSSSRMVVERAFGVLKARFRALLTGITVFDVSEATTWFCVAVILHNICREFAHDPPPVESPIEVHPLPMEPALEEDADAPDIQMEYNAVNAASRATADTDAPHHQFFYHACHVRIDAARAEQIRAMDGVAFSEYVHRYMGCMEKKEIMRGEITAESRSNNGLSMGTSVRRRQRTGSASHGSQCHWQSP